MMTAAILRDLDDCVALRIADPSQGTIAMSKNWDVTTAIVAAIIALSAAGSALAASPDAGTIVKDGSFEKGVFVNTSGNYMALPNDSTTISGWTVFTTQGDIVWAKSPTVDKLSAADGSRCIDLTGFGANAQNGAVAQTIHLVPGASYKFTMDAASFNDTQPVVMLNNQTLTLTAGTPFQVNGTSWTPMTATFTATKSNRTTVLSIGNTTAGAQLGFIDNVSIASN
jgi:hypothetical protein